MKFKFIINIQNKNKNIIINYFLRIKKKLTPLECNLFVNII